MIYIRKGFGISLVFLLFLFSFIQVTNSAATLNSNWTSETPTIDGVISSNEWDGAFQNTITAYDYLSGTTDLQVSFWVMNDASNIYMLVQWADDSLNSAIDTLYIFFDEDNDGNWTGPGTDNVFSCWSSNAFNTWHDRFSNTTLPFGYYTDFNSKDGQASIIYALNTYTVEVSLPIGSTDEEDIQVTAGSLIGLGIFIEDNNTYKYEFPNATWSAHTVVSFQLAKAPPIGTSSILIGLMIMQLIVILKLRKKIN